MKGFAFSAILISLVARGLSTFSPMTSGILMLLIVAFLAFYTSFWLKFAGSESACQWLLGRKKKESVLFSQNIVASLPASEEAKQHLYLIAHYDSKSQSVSPLQGFFPSAFRPRFALAGG
jgi:sorbitol-specific phosphotransferase system component IIC